MRNGRPTADTEPYLHLGPLLETIVSSDDISIIYYTRKSFLSNKGKTWTKPKTGLFKVQWRYLTDQRFVNQLVAFFQKLISYKYKTLVKNHYIDATLYLPDVTYWWFLKNDSEITNIHKEQNHTKPINKNFLRRVFEF